MPLTDRLKASVDESSANVLNTSDTGGYAHQNDKTVVATFFVRFARGLAD